MKFEEKLLKDLRLTELIMDLKEIQRIPSGLNTKFTPWPKLFKLYDPRLKINIFTGREKKIVKQAEICKEITKKLTADISKAKLEITRDPVSSSKD